MPASDAAAGWTSTRRALLLPILAGLIHSLLVAVSFPPFGIWPCIILAPGPLVWAALRGRARPFRTALLASLGMVPLHLYEHQWVIDVSEFGYYPMAIIMGLFGGLFVWTLARIHRHAPRLPLTFLVPLLWTGVEVFRGDAFLTGYPWLLAAHPLIEARFLSLPATLIGAYGVSCLVAVPTGIAADMLLKRRAAARAAFAGAGLIVVVYAVTLALLPNSGSEAHLRIAVVQTNIKQDNKMAWTEAQREADFRDFIALTRQAAGAHPDLIVWPETMFPGSALDPQAVAEQRRAINDLGAARSLPQFADAIAAIQKDLAIPMLVGAVGVDNLRITREGESLHAAYDSLRNSVFLLRDGVVQPERYDKISLTPFGEVIPVLWRWPKLQQMIVGFAAAGMSFGLTPGDRATLFRIPVASSGGKLDAVVATPICFEATRPAVCRRLVRAAGGSPCVLVNLTNDGWFGAFDPGRWQHLQGARWRALELNTPVVRAANTGVSAVIDARGRLLKAGVDGSKQKARIAGVLSADVALSGRPTIYARTGDVFGWTALGASGVLLAVTFLARRAPKKEAA